MAKHRLRALPSLCVTLPESGAERLRVIARHAWGTPIGERTAGAIVLAWGIDHFKQPVPKPPAKAHKRYCLRINEPHAKALVKHAERLGTNYGLAGQIIFVWAIDHYPYKHTPTKPAAKRAGKR